MSIIAKNSRARHDYALQDSLLAGMALASTEVKSIRAGHVSIKGAYCNFRGGELWLVGATVPHYNQATTNHEVDGDRKLLLTKKQLKELTIQRQQGMAIIPLAIMTKGNFIKLEIGVGTPKKQYDKRQTLLQKDDQRRQEKLLKRSR